MSEASGTLIGEFVMRAFHARTAAHVLHLQTRSYAAHKALNEFYDEIVDLVDGIAESYQGAYGLIRFPHTPYEAPGEKPEDMVSKLAEWISTNRFKVCEKTDTELQNQIDEVLALCGSTIYKLRFLA